MGIVDRLKKEYTIKEEWLGLEIHPETPIEGVDLIKRFGADNFKGMKENLKQSAAKYGVEFGKLDFMPNSNNALQTAEYARSIGKHEEYHKLLMDAYFKDSKNIGNIDTLIELGRKSGIDDKDLYNAIKEKKFKSKLKKYAIKANQMNIHSTPTFIINDEHIVSGAQPIEVFRNLFDDIK
ncbi:putative DsbA family dithiol-disulfide isomerase [Tepidibacter aestuarii]|nr:putative DsbA family dithiol-disulfide isomerase [Tepidibacter aestuarii]